MPLHGFQVIFSQKLAAIMRAFITSVWLLSFTMDMSLDINSFKSPPGTHSFFLIPSLQNVGIKFVPYSKNRGGAWYCEIWITRSIKKKKESQALLLTTVSQNFEELLKNDTNKINKFQELLNCLLLQKVNIWIDSFKTICENNMWVHTSYK